MNLHNAEFVRSVTAVADCPKDRLPQIAFAGKSNVGKSSVINKLLLRKNFARVGEAPGKTTHINFFRIDDAMYLVDLPGYGYAKVPQKEKERWGRLMEAYFAAPDTLTFGVMLVDARHAPTANDVVMANYFLQSGKPFVVVANKLDKLKKSEIEPNLACIRQTLSLPDTVALIPFSAEKGYAPVLCSKTFEFCAHGDRAGRGHGIELDELGFLDGINFQHGAVSEDGVMHPRAGRKRVGKRRFIQKAAGKADIFPRLPDEILARRAREGEKLLVDVQQKPRGIPRAAVQIAAFGLA